MCCYCSFAPRKRNLIDLLGESTAGETEGDLEDVADVVTLPNETVLSPTIREKYVLVKVADTTQYKWGRKGKKATPGKRVRHQKRCSMCKKEERKNIFTTWVCCACINITLCEEQACFAKWHSDMDSIY